jgi:hypothetical protein
VGTGMAPVAMVVSPSPRQRAAPRHRPRSLLRPRRRARSRTRAGALLLRAPHLRVPLPHGSLKAGEHRGVVHGRRAALGHELLQLVPVGAQQCPRRVGQLLGWGGEGGRFQGTSVSSRS